MKTKCLVHIKIFMVVTCNSDVMLPFIFLTWLQTQYQVSGSSATQDQKGGYWKTLYKATELYNIYTSRRILAVRKILQPHYQTSGCITPQIANPYIFMGGVVQQVTRTTLCNTQDELNSRIMTEFTNLKKETVRKPCRRLWIYLKAVVEANCSFFE